MRVSEPFAEVLSGCHSSAAGDSGGNSSADAGDEGAFAPEVYQYCTENGRQLVDSSLRSDLASALEDCTMVLALTARTRGAARELGAREAARVAAEAAALPGGKVGLLFGNERTGLSNEDLRWAHATVAIPTAPTPDGVDGNHQALNLSHAVSVMAYEQMLAVEELAGPLPHTKQANPKAMPESGSMAARKLAPVGLRQRLVADMLAAIEAVELLPAEEEATSADEGAHAAGDKAGDGHAEAWQRRQDKDLRAIERVLASGDIYSADCEVLFRLARRVQALRALQGHSGGVLDTHALGAAEALAPLRADGTPWRERTQRERSDAKRALGEVLGEVNLSNREMDRLVKALMSSSKS